MAAIVNLNIDDYKRPKTKKGDPKLPFPYNRIQDKTPPKIPSPTAPPTTGG